MRARSKTGIGIAVALLILASVGATIGYYYVKGVLAGIEREGIEAGPGRIRIHGLTVQLLKLGIAADTLTYVDSTVTSRAIDVAARLLPLGSVLALRPHVAARVGSIDLAVKTGQGAQTQAPPPDSIALRPPGLPVIGSLRVNTLRASIDTIAVRVHGVMVAIGKQDVALRADTVVNPWAPSFALQVAADWSSPDTVAADVSVVTGDDFVHATLRHSKKNLLRGRDSIRAFIEDPRRYDSFGAYPLNLDSVRLDLSLTFSESTRIGAALQANAHSFDSPALEKISSQSVRVSLNAADSTGTWEVNTTGARGERVALSGEIMFPPSLTRLPVGVPQDMQYRIGARGVVRNVPLKLTESEVIHLGVQLHSATLTPRLLEARLTTRDSSTFTVTAYPRRRWRADILADVHRTERLYRVWVDTSVSFSTARLTARYRPPDLHVTARIAKPGGYGFGADSLTAQNSIGPQNYQLVDAQLYFDSLRWGIQGSVAFHPPSPLYFVASLSPSQSVSVSMPVDDSMYFRFKNLNVNALPYAGLPDALPQTSLSGNFAWEMPAGRAELTVAGSLMHDSVDIGINAFWEPESVAVISAKAGFDGSVIQLDARVHTPEARFPQLDRVGLTHIEYAHLEAQEVNIPGLSAIAGFAGMFSSGTVRGALEYSRDAGFDGGLEVSNVQLVDSDVDAVLESVTAQARNDTLTIIAVTSSPSQSLYNDSMYVRVADFTRNAHITIEALAGDDLRAGFEGGRDTATNEIAGSIKVSGSLVLPAGMGEIDNIDATAKVVVQLASPEREVLVSEGSIRARYRPAESESYQWMHATVAYRGDTIDIEKLVISAGTDTLTGSARYALGDGHLDAQLSGDRFSLAYGPVREATLHGVEARVQMAEETTIFLKANICSLNYVAAPTEFTGRFTSVESHVRIPSADGSGGVVDAALPEVSLKATMQSSVIRYKIARLSYLVQLVEGFARGQGEADDEGAALRFKIDASVQTQGADHRVESEVLELSYTSALDVRGTYPFMLLDGYIEGRDGAIGAPGQRYTLEVFSVRWPDVQLKDGRLSMEAAKRLAEDCEPGTTDSCTVYSLLQGTVGNVQFDYRTNCAGSYGEGASMTALMNSVARGCFSERFGTGPGGPSMSEQALGLLEPQLSRRLYGLTSHFASSWLADIQVEGLGSLVADSARHPVSLEITTKNFKGIQLIGSAGYRPNTSDAASPWAYRLALTWQPPFRLLPETSLLARMFEDRLRVEAAVERDAKFEEERNEDGMRNRIGILYGLEFW